MKAAISPASNQISNFQFLISFLITILFLASSCGNNSDNLEKEEKKNGPTPEASASTVTISKQQFTSLSIELGTIGQKNLSSLLKVTGNLSVPPQSKANITSIIGGTVQRILVQEGDHVNQGQAVVTLLNPDFVKMQENYLDAKAQLTFAEANYYRQKELSEKNVTAQKTFQEAESNYQSLKAKVSSLKNQLSMVGINTASLTPDNITNTISIAAPISGSIANIDVNIGVTADATTHLMDVVDNSHLHLDVFVFEQDLPKVKKDQTIDFSLTNLPGKHYTAKIFSIGSAFVGESKTIPVHAEIIGDKTGLIEGMNVIAYINIGNSLTTAVLSDAIISNGGNDYIFIKTEGHHYRDHSHNEKETQTEKEELGDAFTFKKIQVKTGIVNSGYTEITPLEEVSENANVVTDGAYYLMAELNAPGEQE